MGIFTSMSDPRQTPETTPQDAQSTTLPPRPGEQPTARGVPARRERSTVARWVSWRTPEDAYDDRVIPMEEMP